MSHFISNKWILMFIASALVSQVITKRPLQCFPSHYSCFHLKTPWENSVELNRSQCRTHAVSLQNDIQLKRRPWPLWWIRLSPKWRMSRGCEGHDGPCVEGGKHNEMHCTISQSPKMTLPMLNMNIPGTHAEPHSDMSVKTHACVSCLSFLVKYKWLFPLTAKNKNITYLRIGSFLHIDYSAENNTDIFLFALAVTFFCLEFKITTRS